MLCSSSATALSLPWEGKEPSNQGRSAEGTVPPGTAGTFKGMFSKAAANLACTRSLCV